LTNTSPRRGEGRSTSSIRSTSGGPYRVHTAALIVIPAELRRPQPRCAYGATRVRDVEAEMNSPPTSRAVVFSVCKASPSGGLHDHEPTVAAGSRAQRPEILPRRPPPRHPSPRRPAARGPWRPVIGREHNRRINEPCLSVDGGSAPGPRSQPDEIMVATLGGPAEDRWPAVEPAAIFRTSRRVGSQCCGRSRAASPGAAAIDHTALRPPACTRSSTSGGP
jgi:hypothetical protein